MIVGWSAHIRSARHNVELKLINQFVLSRVSKKGTTETSPGIINFWGLIKTFNLLMFFGCVNCIELEGLYFFTTKDPLMPRTFWNTVYHGVFNGNWCDCYGRYVLYSSTCTDGWHKLEGCWPCGRGGVDSYSPSLGTCVRTNSRHWHIGVSPHSDSWQRWF